MESADCVYAFATVWAVLLVVWSTCDDPMSILLSAFFFLADFDIIWGLLLPETVLKLGELFLSDT